MKFVMYKDCVSPHQVPLAMEFVRRFGVDNFRYIYRDKSQSDRVRLGWSMDENEPWFIHIGTQPELAHELIENADGLLTMFRDTELISRRCSKGLKTFYDSERWFKPICIDFCTKCKFCLPGWMKLFSPSYFVLAMEIAKFILKQKNFHYLPIGPHAARDMRLICRIYSILHLHFSPLPSFIPWGYFVKDANQASEKVKKRNHKIVKVLYVGRLLKLKHVDTIIRAVARLNSKSTTTIFKLTIVGDGPEKTNLQKLVNSIVSLNLRPQPITFQPCVPISEVRTIMRQHDVLVFASDALDGWGAVVSEALSEGTPVIGTYETGASAALLPTSQLYHCGDWKALSEILKTSKCEVCNLPKAYTPNGGAERLISNMHISEKGKINHD